MRFGLGTADVFYTDGILKALGIPCFEGFDAARVAQISGDCALVIHSAAYSAANNREMAEAKLSEEVKAELTRRYRSYNPVVLQREVRAAIEALADIHAAVADCQSDTRRSGHRRVRIL